ncbi:MAG: PKD domain-containing protein, partial [Bacteroidetes bacterium]
MRKHILLVFFLFFNLICYAQSWLENRTETAQNIVEGEIIAQESFSKNGWIYTKNSILVNQTFKGSNLKTVEMISLGGILDNKMTKTSGMMPKIGDVGVFFAKDGEMLPQSMIKYDRLQKIAISHVGELYKDLGNLYQKLGANPEKLIQNPLFYQKPESNKRTEAINIESFFPTSLSAGTRSKITINGSGFGATRGNGNVFFSDARTGGATFTQMFSNFGILPIPRPPIFNNSEPELISWSDTKIEVYVPSFAGSGEIAVINDAKELFRTIDKLTVDFSLETAPANNPNNGVKPAVNADLINSNGTGGYTLFVDPQIFQNNVALTALSRGLNNWRCATGINIELAASQATINFGARGISTIIGGGGINNFDVISQYDFCNTGTEQAWRMEEFQIIVNLQQVQRAGIDLESQILHLLGRASQLGYVNDPKDLMYFQLNAGEQKRSLSANNTKATNFIVNQSLVVNDCGPKPMILVNSTNCSNSIEKPQARFSSDKTGLCGSGTIVFKDESKNASSVLWTFNGGNPATSTARNPKVDYSAAGIYDVQMLATNPAGTDTGLKKFYIVVGTAGQIKIDLG